MLTRPILKKSILSFQVIAFLCIYIHSASGQSKTVQISRLMDQLSERGQFSGEILVSYHGKKIYSNGFGKADKKQNVSFGPNTPCYIASLSKSFTAMAVMILADRHQLSFDDSVKKFFPDIPVVTNITVRNLLNHTSGIPDYVHLGYEHPGVTNIEIIEELSKCKALDFSPGAKFEYSNSNYVLLAAIIEKVANRTYKNFIEQEIFKTLRMTHSFVYSRTSAEKFGVAHAYDRFGVDDDYNLLTEGDGSIYSTVNDFYKWDKALNANKLVSRATFIQALTPPILKSGEQSSYGFGWAIGELEGEPTASHAGEYGGFNTYIKRFLKSHTSIIFFTNNGFENIKAIGDAIVNVLYERTYQIPKLSIANAMNGIYEKYGLDSAIREYKILKQSDGIYDCRESELNEFGYHLLSLKKVDAAVAILKLNTQEYPNSSNAFESLGEANLIKDDKTEAIKNFNKALEIDPNNVDALSFMKKLR